MAIVLITDHAWPGVDIERAILEQAGHELVAPSGVTHAGALTALDVQREVALNQPAAILTCWAPVSAMAMASDLALRVVARMGVGLDNIAVDRATVQGVWVTNVPDYCVEEVSDHAVALTLCLLRGVVTLNAQVQQGSWRPSEAKLLRASQLTAGVLGYGRIGLRTATKLRALGMRVLAPARESAPTEGPAELVELRDLLRIADVLLLHVPLTQDTKHMVEDTFIAQMKPGSLLVNCSRGAVVETGALLRALDAGHLGGAALDVVEEEPNPPSALLGRPNVILTPHVGFSSAASLLELRTRATEEVVRVLGGARPHDPCNEPAVEPLGR